MIELSIAMLAERRNNCSFCHLTVVASPSRRVTETVYSSSSILDLRDWSYFRASKPLGEALPQSMWGQPQASSLLDHVRDGA
jgi:hypothetical protein